MLRSISNETEAAISVSATVCHQRQHLAEPLWFAVLCRYLWGTNAPKDLRFILGDRWSERTYRGWAAGDNEPPASVLALLIVSEHGFRVIAWIVGDIVVTWWTNVQRAIRITAHIDKLDIS